MFRTKVVISIVLDQLNIVEHTRFRRKCCTSQRRAEADDTSVIHTDDVGCVAVVGVGVGVGAGCVGRQGRGKCSNSGSGHMTALNSCLIKFGSGSYPATATLVAGTTSQYRHVLFVKFIFLFHLSHTLTCLYVVSGLLKLVLGLLQIPILLGPGLSH